MRETKDIDKAAAIIARQAEEIMSISQGDTLTIFDIRAVAQIASRLALTQVLCEHDQDAANMQGLRQFDDHEQAVIDFTNELFPQSTIEEVA